MTIAGSGTNPDGENVPATDVALDLPLGISVDVDGNIYIAENGANRIRRIDAITGSISTVAGTGEDGFSGDGGPATAAQLSRPQGVSVSADGEIFIADTGNRVVRRVDPLTGFIETYAGTGQLGEVPARVSVARDSASFGEIVDVLVGTTGLQIADGASTGGAGNNAIILVSLTDGTTLRAAGTGSFNFAGDGGDALNAGLSVEQLAFGPDGTLLFADSFNHRIRQLELVALENSTEILQITTAAGRGLTDIDFILNQTFSGDGGDARDARLHFPSGMVTDKSGIIFIADSQNHRIRSVEANGDIVTIAGTGEFGSTGDGGLAILSSVENPARLSLDQNGDLLIVEPIGGRVRRLVDPLFRTTFLEIDRTDIDFGSVDLGIGAAQVIRVQNLGNTDLTFTDLDSNSPRFSINLELPFVVGPGEVVELPVRFDPIDRDLVEATITVRSDDPFRPAIAVTLQGSGIVPDLELLPLEAEFESTFTNEFREQTFRLSNVDQGLLLVEGLVLSDTLSFSIGIDDTSVASGDFSIIRVVFQPRVEGSIQGTLTILTNDPDENSVLVPLSGFGRIGQPGGFLDLSQSLGVDDSGAAFGVSWADYDRDGDSDLYVVRSFQPNLLYQNNGGSFLEVGGTLGIGDAGDGSGAAWADADGDGDLDLYVTNFGQPNKLFMNDAGGFVEVAAQYGVDDAGDGFGAAWGDVDNDGDPDLYIANFGNNVFYQNTATGQFTEASVAVGVADGSSGVQPVYSDFDADGDLDLFLANSGPNRYWVNESGTFEDAISQFSPADDGPSFGAAVGDFDNDGDIDLYVSYFDEANRLYRNDGDQFIDVALAAGVNDPSRSRGSVWADFNNDGRLDLFVTNAGQPNRAYRSEGIQFIELAEDFGVAIEDDSRGVALADYDADGGLDLFVAIQGGADRLYRNQEANGNWIGISPMGTSSSFDGIGTRVELVYNGGKRQIREITGGTSFLSQDALCAHFGLGDATTVDTLTIRWPSGIVQRFEGGTLNVNTLLQIEETDPAPPAAIDVAPTIRVLVANGLAETNISVTILDSLGQISLINDRDVTFSLDFGAGEIVGPSSRRLRDGQAAARYRAGTFPARVGVIISVMGLPSEEIEIELIPPIDDTSTFISTVAGTGSPGFFGDGGLATNASLQLPRAVAVNNSGDVFAGDTQNRVRRIDAVTGIITLIGGNGSTPSPLFDGSAGPAVSAPIGNPRGLAFLPSGGLLVSEFGGQQLRLIDLTTGIISEFAGRGVAASGGDGGPAIDATFQSPAGIFVDADGVTFVAERFGQRVRRIDASGIIMAAAGSFEAGFSGDGAAATDARLNHPNAVTLDENGNLYIADLSNNRIRRVDASGTISTIAGTNVAGFGGDGGPALLATLDGPQGVAVDASNRLYVADSGNNRIRVIDLATGLIQTVAGSGASGRTGSEGPGLSFSLNEPSALAVAPNSTLIIADTGNHRILRLTVTLQGETPSDPPPSGDDADFNGDGAVDFADFVLFSGAFGTNTSAFDLDRDGVVGFSDFLAFSKAFGTGSDGSATRPVWLKSKG